MDAPLNAHALLRGRDFRSVALTRGARCTGGATRLCVRVTRSLSSSHLPWLGAVEDDGIVASAALCGAASSSIAPCHMSRVSTKLLSSAGAFDSCCVIISGVAGRGTVAALRGGGGSAIRSLCRPPNEPLRVVVPALSSPSLPPSAAIGVLKEALLHTSTSEVAVLFWRGRKEAVREARDGGALVGMRFLASMTILSDRLGSSRSDSITWRVHGERSKLRSEASCAQNIPQSPAARK